MLFFYTFILTAGIHLHRMTAPCQLPGNDIRSVVVDQSDNKWIGIYGNGLAVYNNNGVDAIWNDNLIKVQYAKSYILSQNYPNPFNATTNIEYTLPRPGNVRLTVYDISGKIIRELVNEHQSAGEYSIIFDTYGFASGIYFYEINIGSNTRLTKKMVLLK